MRIPELLAPAGSFEGVRAAVQSGATAVYMALQPLTPGAARRISAGKKWRRRSAIAVRAGSRTNITFNIVALDREREAAMQDVKFLNNAARTR